MNNDREVVYQVIMNGVWTDTNLEGYKKQSRRRKLFTSPQPDQSAYIKRLEDALTASLALNINWSSEAETEMLSYFSEYKDVIKQAKEVLASKESE